MEDLGAERTAAFRAITGLDHLGDEASLWPAQPKSPTSASLERVGHADVLIVIVAHRYGDVKPGSAASVTELEVREAVRRKIPVLAFFLDADTPWPPRFVERDRQDELARFKAYIGQHATVKVFRTADELAMQITQAVVQLDIAHPSEGRGVPVFSGWTVAGAKPAQLRTRPDAVIEVGTSEDGLPMLLRVGRSRNLAQLFDDLEHALRRTTPSPAYAHVLELRQSVTQQAPAVWCADDVFEVALSDGVSQEMYVCPQPLMRLSRSLLSRVLSTSKDLVSRRTGTQQSIHSPDTISPRGSSDTAGVMSFGGKNRFLGVPLDGSDPHVVGKDREKRWVSWHPFIEESLAALEVSEFKLSTRRPIRSVDYDFELAAPGVSEFRFSARRAVHPDDYEDELTAEAALVVLGEPPGTAARLPLVAIAQIPRTALLTLVALVADQVDAGHAGQFLHCDVKPDNILVRAYGPELIDSFEVAIGDRAPGWTPHWSSPEQILGGPLTPEADVFSLGCLVAAALAAPLVGEVKRVRALNADHEISGFDVLHDPVPSIATDRFTDDLGRRGWVDLIRRCLRFDVDKRECSAAVVADAVRTLVEEAPPSGSVSLHSPYDLAAATLSDGTQRVCRLISSRSADTTELLRPPLTQRVELL
jgi:hypothetical protein